MAILTLAYRQKMDTKTSSLTTLKKQLLKFLKGCTKTDKHDVYTHTCVYTHLLYKHYQHINNDRLPT